jgi:hypothetical protein
MKENQMSDLNTLFPSAEIEVQGELLSISPFTFGQLPRVLKLTKSFYAEVQPFFDGTSDQTEAVMHVLAVGGDDLIELIALGIKKPVSYFETLQIDDGIRVATTFLEVNLSFFAQRVLPQIKLSMGTLQKLATEKLSQSL